MAHDWPLMDRSEFMARGEQAAAINGVGGKYYIRNTKDGLCMLVFDGDGPVDLTDVCILGKDVEYMEALRIVMEDLAEDMGK